MEFSEHVFLEELLALSRDTTEMNHFSDCNWSYDSCFSTSNENPVTIFPNNYLFNEAAAAAVAAYDHYCPQLTDSSSMNTTSLDSYSFPVQERIPLMTSMMEFEDDDQEEPSNLLADDFQNLEMLQSCFKVEPIIVHHQHHQDQHESPEMQVPVFNMGTANKTDNEKKGRNKKLDGQPSKNLMAERRRRKRLNDRLSLLRSIVPKISKMDRTSILADTIDYMKELLEKIRNLQQEIEASAGSINHLERSGIFKDVKPNEIVVRNSPKFDVERREMDTRIEICCAGKPGLLLSTVTSLEAVGLEIQQCVISCFNDFSMQASCSDSEEMEQQRAMLSPEDIKQTLFRNAGYGGRCL